MALSEAPAPFDINLDDASNAWKQLRESEHQDFAWAIFTFPENLFAKCLEVHRQEKGGMTEMCEKIREVTNKNTKACWGGFKVHSVDKSNFKDHCVKFVGFQCVPSGCKINAKRVAKDVRPHVEELLVGTDVFVDVASIDDLSDTPENCQSLAEKLNLGDDRALQCHSVADVAPISSAFQEVLQCPDDLFSYVLVVPHIGLERTFDVIKSTEGGITEMTASIESYAETNRPVFGAYKALAVGEAAATSSTKHIKFLCASSEARKAYNRVIAETRPYIMGAFEDVDLTIDVESAKELGDLAGLHTRLALQEGITVQLHSVRNLAVAKSAIEDVSKTERDDFKFAVVTTSENSLTRDLSVVHSKEGGMDEMMRMLKDIAESGRPSYGLFKVQSVDDQSFARKKPIRTKFVAFRHIPQGDLSLVAEIGPHMVNILDVQGRDMYIDTRDVDDISNIMSIANHLRVDDPYCFYEFGGAVSVRTSVLLSVDKAGTESVEIAHTMDAWGRVLSDIRRETFALFSLTPDRKVLEVVVDGTGPGLKSCQLATNILMELKMPAWGVFRVGGLNEKNNKASSRSKFVGFQVIPPDTPPSVSSTVRLMKPLLRETLKQATYWIEAESSDCFSEEVVTKKLTDMSGAENATKFDFGGELGEGEAAYVKQEVEKHLQKHGPFAREKTAAGA